MRREFYGLNMADYVRNNFCKGNLTSIKKVKETNLNQILWPSKLNLTPQNNNQGNIINNVSRCIKLKAISRY